MTDTSGRNPLDAESETLGQRVRSARERKGMTQEQLAELVLESGRKATVSQWENDNAAPRAAELKRLCEVLGVSSDWLLGLEHAPAQLARLGGLTTEERRYLLALLQAASNPLESAMDRLESGMLQNHRTPEQMAADAEAIARAEDWGGKARGNG